MKAKNETQNGNELLIGNETVFRNELEMNAGNEPEMNCKKIVEMNKHIRKTYKKQKELENCHNWKCRESHKAKHKNTNNKSTGLYHQIIQQNYFDEQKADIPILTETIISMR